MLTPNFSMDFFEALAFQSTGKQLLLPPKAPSQYKNFKVDEI